MKINVTLPSVLYKILYVGLIMVLITDIH